MSQDYIENLPPELLLLLAPSLPIASLNAFISTCRRTHKILQPELESRITAKLALQLLHWAASSKPHIVTKLLSPPHSVNPSPGAGWFFETPLHVAAKAGNLETAKLLLDAGAETVFRCDQEDYQPFHLAAINKDFAMMKLLLDHGAPIDDNFGCDGYTENALQYACSIGNIDMVKLLVERDARLEHRGHCGTALGFAVHARNIEVVRFLLEQGAKAEVSVPLFVFLDGSISRPHKGSLLYVAMGLRHPNARANGHRDQVLLHGAEEEISARWQGLPLGEGRRDLMALLMAYGATKDGAWVTIAQFLGRLANAVFYTEEEYLRIINEMLKEAEEAIPKVLNKYKVSPQ
ncbi:ankyrin repeat-containing domain protein [Favolaschia claudopus]|uniref:Ankyrin repeat-containing domain protein n=1 Tax=Favolaschia claudopus TaxID=2862362 RepID=A0AAW0BFF1_9AGAR